MNVRITPFSNLATQVKTCVKTKPVYNRNRFASLNTLHRGRTNLDKSKHAIASIATKKISSANKNNLLILSNNNIHKPRLPVKISSNMVQPATVTSKKRVLLYQQIERNKIFSNGAELINRFHFKV